MMMKRTWILFVLAAALVATGVSLKACAKESTPPAADSAATSQPATSTPAPASQTPAAAAEQIQEAQTAQESAGDNAPSDRGDAGLERLAALPADQQLPGGRWTAGTNYTPLVPSQPTTVGAGEVEVAEVFWYGCPHCYALEPYLESWDKNNADYIKLVKIPVIWSPGHRAHARLFYALEALGRRDLHKKVFQAIHEGRNPLWANSERETAQMHVDFARANGLDEKKFLQAYNSFSVNSNLQRAERLTTAYRVQSVPIVVVNGKYVTDIEKARGHEELMQLLNDLAASERR
jgi:protein dithiol oxidoreductase (disulfide-forming)